MNNAHRMNNASYEMFVEIGGVRYPVQSSGHLTDEGARLDAAVIRALRAAGLPSSPLFNRDGTAVGAIEPGGRGIHFHL